MKKATLDYSVLSLPPAKTIKVMVRILDLFSLISCIFSSLVKERSVMDFEEFVFLGNF